MAGCAPHLMNHAVLRCAVPMSVYIEYFTLQGFLHEGDVIFVAEYPHGNCDDDALVLTKLGIGKMYNFRSIRQNGFLRLVGE